MENTHCDYSWKIQGWLFLEWLHPVQIMEKCPFNDRAARQVVGFMENSIKCHTAKTVLFVTHPPSNFMATSGSCPHGQPCKQHNDCCSIWPNNISAAYFCIFFGRNYFCRMHKLEMQMWSFCRNALSVDTNAFVTCAESIKTCNCDLIGFVPRGSHQASNSLAFWLAHFECSDCNETCWRGKMGPPESVQTFFI